MTSGNIPLATSRSKNAACIRPQSAASAIVTTISTRTAYCTPRTTLARCRLVRVIEGCFFPWCSQRSAVRSLLEPLLVDPVVLAIGSGLGEHLVDCVEQRGVARPDGDAVLLVGIELRGHLEVGLAIHPVIEHTVVVDASSDVTGLHGVEQQAEVLEDDDVDAVGVLIGVLLTSGPVLHGEPLALELLKTGQPRTLLRHQRLGGV